MIKNFLKNFSQNFVKIVLCGIVGSERKIKRAWETRQQAKCSAFSKNSTLFLCLLRSLSYYKVKKRRERKREIAHDNLLLEKGNLLHETVTSKIGCTIFEVLTICSGSELLYDKMERLIKAESGKIPTDKENY